MQKDTFLIKLALLTTTLVLSLLALQHFQPAFEPYAPVTWMSIVFFTGFSWTVHIFGKIAAADENKNAFIRFVMMVIMGKLFFSVFLVVGYVLVMEPSNRMVVLPFIPIYIIYTIFETNYLMGLAKNTK